MNTFETPEDLGKPASGRPAHAAAPQKLSFVDNLYEWVEAIVFALICVVLIFTFLFRTVGVDGGSMETTLMDGDRLILATGFYSLDHGDVVVVNRDGKEPIIKRVVALAGDSVDIRDGMLYVNGQPVDEPYLDSFQVTEAKTMTGYPLTVPEDHVFVLGDNRIISHDSRFTDIGFVSVDQVVGKGLFRFWPINQFLWLA